MGFRDFELFNQAMLVKHGWRLITKPDSLCARVIKGKYFNDRNFMEAGRKRGSSHTWHAILYDRDALQGGLIKRVGDGSTIHVWEDPWIAENFNSKPLVRKSDVNILKVGEIIDHENGSWDMQRLERNFVPAYVQTICRIPIGNITEDTWAWKHEKGGYFSVRSAYKLLCQQRRHSENTIES